MPVTKHQLKIGGKVSPIVPETENPNEVVNLGQVEGMMEEIGVSQRTVKPISNTTQYTLVAEDFTDYILDFTANGGETIDVILNTGVAPENGQIQAISSGNNFLLPTAGTGVTLVHPEGTTLKSTSGGWIGIMPLSTENTFAVNGNLESTDTGYDDTELRGMIEDAESDIIDHEERIQVLEDNPTGGIILWGVDEWIQIENLIGIEVQDLTHSAWVKSGSNVTQAADGFEYTRTVEAWPSWTRLTWAIDPTGLIKFGIKAKYVDVQYLVFLQVITPNNDVSIDLINGTVAYKRDDQIPVTVTYAGNDWWLIEITSVPALKDEFVEVPYMQINASATGMTNSDAGNIGSCLLKEPFVYQL